MIQASFIVVQLDKYKSVVVRFSSISKVPGSNIKKYFLPYPVFYTQQYFFVIFYHFFNVVTNSSEESKSRTIQLAHTIDWSAQLHYTRVLDMILCGLFSQPLDKTTRLYDQTFQHKKRVGPNSL